MKNRPILWIALASLFLNVGVISAAGFVIWQNGGLNHQEPWETLEESGWTDDDWKQLDKLLDGRSDRIDALFDTIDSKAEVLFDTLWAEDLQADQALENFLAVEDQRTALSRTLFIEFVDYLKTLPFEKRSALLEFLLEEDEFAIWFY